MLFAHIKRNLALRRFRLRGLTGASDELLLAATVQNLKKLVVSPPTDHREASRFRVDANTYPPKPAHHRIGGQSPNQFSANLLSSR